MKGTVINGKQVCQHNNLVCWKGSQHTPKGTVQQKEGSKIYSIFNSLSWQKDKYQTDPKLILYFTGNRNINIAPETLNKHSWRKKRSNFITGSYSVEVLSMVTQRTATLLALFWMFVRSSYTWLHVSLSFTSEKNCVCVFLCS